MPKRIAVCFDGTWNTPADDEDKRSGPFRQRQDAYFEGDEEADGVETNVCRIYRSIYKEAAGATAENSMRQIKWYDKGVGTNWYDRVVGGGFGIGLSEKIREGYRFLSDHYEDDDEVFIFGFSRGAYTARSLVGLIRNAGLLSTGAGDDDVMDAYVLYRTRDSHAGGADSEAAQIFRARMGSRIIPIKFLGVWDTVGALGIPVRAFGQFNAELFQFHDTELSRIVQNAYQALAIDEHRETFQPTLWQPIEKPGQTIEQRWFVGAHGDVGGGNQERILSDRALRWMQQMADSHGLRLKPLAEPVAAESSPLGDIYDSFSAFLGGVYGRFSQRFYRPLGSAQFGNERLHNSVRDRAARDMNYRPKNKGYPELEKIGDD